MTSLLPFPPTWYNVLESPRLRRRGTNVRTGRRDGDGRVPSDSKRVRRLSRGPTLLLSVPLSLSLARPPALPSLPLAPGHNRTLQWRVSYSWLMLQNHNRGKLLAWLFHRSANVCGVHAPRSFYELFPFHPHPVSLPSFFRRERTERGLRSALKIPTIPFQPCRDGP